MNDLALLDTHGPDAAPLTDDARARARTALLAGIVEEPAATVPAPAGPRRRAVLLLAAASVAAAVAVVPGLLPSADRGAVALAPARPLELPLTPGTVPPGLAGPVFDYQPSLAFESWAGAGADRLALVVPRQDDYWDVPGNAQHVDLTGRDDAVLVPGRGSLSVVWTDDDGDRVGVTGKGAWADAARLTGFAETVRDEPQSVDTGLGVAPRGWHVLAYLSGHHVTYRAGDGSGDELAVVLGEQAAEPAAYGAVDVTREVVHGQPAWVGATRQDGLGWVVVARATDGRPFSVLAPASFTRAQALEVAAGVDPGA